MFDFVFGPNGSFYARASGRTFTHNLPPGLTQLLSDPKQAESVYCVALGPDSSYFVAYKDIKTDRVQIDSKDVSPKLNSWLYLDEAKQKISPRRHIPTIRVFFGKDKSYFAFDRKGYSCSHITTALVDFMESEVEARGSYYPTMVGIGTHGLFFVERAEIKKWNVPTEHPKLKAYLDPEYAKESGQSGYFLEGKLQNVVIDPFTTPAQVIVQDQNGWLYDIPQLAQDGAASKVIEDMNQHVLTAPPMPKPVPKKSLDSKSPDKSPQDTNRYNPVPGNQLPKPLEPNFWQKHAKKPTPVMPQVGEEAKRKAFEAAYRAFSTRKERDPDPKAGPATVGPEDKQPKLEVRPIVSGDRPRPRPVPIYSEVPQETLSAAVTAAIGDTHPQVPNLVERKSSKASPRIGVVETAPKPRVTEPPELRPQEDSTVNRLLKAQAYSLQMIQKALDEVRVHTTEFNQITKQLEEARAQVQRPREPTTIPDSAAPILPTRQHHRAPSIRSLRDRLDDLRTPKVEQPAFVFPDRIATNRTPAPAGPRVGNPYLQPSNPYRSPPMPQNKSASNLSLSETLSRSGSTTPIEPPVPVPMTTASPSVLHPTGSAPIPASDTIVANPDLFVLRLQELYGPSSATATAPQREAMARLWELYGPGPSSGADGKQQDNGGEGPLRTMLQGMTQTQMLVAMAWSLDMDVNQMYNLFGPGLSYATNGHVGPGATTPSFDPNLMTMMMLDRGGAAGAAGGIAGLDPFGPLAATSAAAACVVM